jgi:Fe-Mn family superoxide dismutase
MDHLKTSIQPTNEHFVRGLPFKAHKINGFTPELLERYYEEGYGGSIRSLTEIEAKISTARQANGPKSELIPLVARQAELVGYIVLQELFLEGLAEDGGQDIEDGDLKQELAKVFGDVSNWRAEFAMMATSQSEAPEWVVLVWCERFGRLQNVATHDGKLALGGSVPILALDLRSHVYASDFDDDQLAYVRTYLQNINWSRVAQILDAVRHPGSQREEQSNSSEQVSVAELKQMMENQAEAPLVLDIRHDDDCERYTSRIADTNWRDSFKVADWVGDLPKDKPVVVYCMYGFWVSQKVAEELRAEGFDARSLKGGVTAWRAMGLPSTDYKT